jgi:hypothetical protein
MQLQINPTVWGPSLWRVLHSLAFSISQTPDPQKTRQFLELVDSLRNLLPCEECRLHFDDYVNENNPKKASDLAYWTFELHNSVNKRLGKPQFSFDDVSKLYLNDQCTMNCSTPKSDEKNDTFLVFILFFVLLVSVILVYCFKK